MREKLLTSAVVVFTFCASFKRAINRPKTDPRQFFFFSYLFINGQAFIETYKLLSIISPLKTITDPLKDTKMVKTDPKKVPSKIFFLLVPLGAIAQLLTKKNFPLHNPFKFQIK